MLTVGCDNQSVKEAGTAGSASKKPSLSGKDLESLRTSNGLSLSNRGMMSWLQNRASLTHV